MANGTRTTAKNWYLFYSPNGDLRSLSTEESMSSNSRKWKWLPASGFFLALTLALGLALPTQAAQVLAKVGALQIQRGGKMVPVVVGTRLREGDEMVSEPGAEALLRLDDGARLAVRPNSILQFKTLQRRGRVDQRKMALRIAQGGLRYLSSKSTLRHSIQFETPTATIGIRGTDIEISITDLPVDENVTGTYLKVNTGAAILQAVDGTVVEVDPGQVAFGGEPELVPRGPGGTRRPAGRKVEPITGLFKAGLLDKLMGNTK